MSGNSDDQSEDGELRQSPVSMAHQKHSGTTKMDYNSDEEDDIEPMDSLDIKPPQAKAVEHRTSSKHSSSRNQEQRSRHSKRSDKHREERHGRREKHQHRVDKQSRSTNKDHYQREKERYYRDKQAFEQQMYAEHSQFHNSERVFRDRKAEDTSRHKHDKIAAAGSSGVVNKEASKTKEHGKRNRYEDEKRDRASKALADLRERLIEKRGKHDDVFPKAEGSSRSEEKRERRRREENHEDPLEGEAGNYVKEIINITTEERKYRKEREVEKLTDEERAQQEQRREKLLEAEREMARLKEQSRLERERRHQEKASKRKQQEKDEEEQIEMYKKRVKLAVKQHRARQQYEAEEERRRHAAAQEEEEEDTHVVTVSDDNSEEHYEEVSNKSEEDDNTDDQDEEESDEEASSEHSRSDRSRTKSRSASRSRSRSRSRHSSDEEERRSRSRTLSPRRSPLDDDEDDMIMEKEHNRRPDTDEENIVPKIDEDLPPYYPAVQGCRSVEEFQCLNRIEEGTYGVVYRARDKRTDEIVALKRLKMEKEKEGFPITSLREINTLLKGQHHNIVTVREIVVGSNMDKIFIVMDYVEHDLKSLMETMRHKRQSFMAGEIKCLLRQLLEAVSHLHDNWILHRDLKTSNLLLSHKGILKVGDFGLAREYGSPLKAYTPIVVTLWYRAPELLLCAKEYSTPIDIWSVGCIFAELLLMNALFPGKSEVDQLNRVFKDLGTPSEKIWTGFNQLPAVKKMKFNEYPVSNLRAKFNMLSEVGLGLLIKFLTFDPAQRITAEDALKHAFFNEAPLPIDPAMFPTWPAKSELGQKRALAASPKPPSGGGEYKRLEEDDGYGFRLGMGVDNNRRGGPGFSLKF